MKYVCNYCEHNFAKQSNLYKHQRTTKYCIKLQEEKLEQATQLTCEYCQLIVSRSDSLNRHYLTCLEYRVHLQTMVIENELKNARERIIEKDQQLREKNLQIKELTDLAVNKPNTQITNIGGNLDEVAQIVETIERGADKTLRQDIERIKQVLDKLYKQIFPCPARGGALLMGNSENDSLS